MGKRNGDTCKRGHPQTPENTYLKDGKYRCCLKCRHHVRSSKVRGHNLRAKYGLTPEQVDAIALSQLGLCAICSRPPTRKGLVVDHSHKTGQVRGLLCNRCNLRLGEVEKDPEWHSRAEAYLDQWENFIGVDSGMHAPEEVAGGTSDTILPAG